MLHNFLLNKNHVIDWGGIMDLPKIINSQFKKISSLIFMINKKVHFKCGCHYVLLDLGNLSTMA